MKYYAIIVAGGTGSRMQTELPKQFLPLNGKPVLMHTIEAFHYSDLTPEIILVLSSAYFEYWKELCKTTNFGVPHKIVFGGKTRFESVKNSISEIHEQAIVAIHDAVRPLITNEIITAAYKLAEHQGSAVTAVQSRDSIRKADGRTSVALNRESIFLVQTPQVFQSDILKKAYKQAYRDEFTDDASVVEYSGVPVQLIEGSSKNIKITFPEDIGIAESILRIELNKKSPA